MTATEPGPDQAAVAGILDSSDERDLQLALRLAAWREGYAAAAAQFSEHEERGYIRAIGDFKAACHGTIRDIEAQLAMWDGPRQRFGSPRPDDYQGGPVQPW